MERKHVCYVHAPPEDSLTTTAAAAAAAAAAEATEAAAAAAAEAAAEATEAGKNRRLSTSMMLCKLHKYLISNTKIMIISECHSYLFTCNYPYAIFAEYLQSCPCKKIAMQ